MGGQLPDKPAEFRVAADLCHPTRCIPADTQNRDVFEIFDTDSSLNSLPVIDEERIVGLISRERFMISMAKRFHWELYGKKRCTKMMVHDPLVVEAETLIGDVANLLLGNNEKHALSDAFVVARNGILLGIGYTSDVMATLLQQERQASAELRRHHDRLSEMVDERTHDLMLAKLAAEQANLAKSEFLANISHELRTPLHAVLAFAKFGTEKSAEGPRDKLGQYFVRINESAERLTHLVNDLLDLSHLDAFSLELELAPVDLCELAGKVRAEFLPIARLRRIELRQDNCSETAPIVCDRERIRQVLANILSNAIKYSAEGSTVWCRLHAYPSAAAAQEPHSAGYRLQIVDQGPGIPEGELDSIFERFTQSSVTRTGAGGSGLGLAISREIMRLHCGRITASNNANGGACFSIEFPASLK